MNATEAGGATPSSQDQRQVTLTAASEELRQQLDAQHIKEETNQDEQHSNAHALPTNNHPSELDSKNTDTAETNLSSIPGIALKKRKRAASPPWQFPTADQTTIKLSDGRRSSARVNTSVSNTPGLSENESTGRLASRAASSRLSSPPWKEFKAEGPTSLQVDGVRKSGRVNKELTTPKRVSPRSKKQMDKLAGQVVKTQAKKHVESPRGKVQRDGNRRASSKTGDWAKVDELSARIAELETRRQSLTEQDDNVKTTDWRDHDGDDAIKVSSRKKSPDTSRKGQLPTMTRVTPRIKLRFNSARHEVLPPHPHASIPELIHPPHPSLWQLIEDCELREMQQPYSENERGPPSREEFEKRHLKAAEQEGILRQRLVDAGKPGGILSEEKCSIYNDALPQIEPPKQYGHCDHLVSHIIWFRQLQTKEDTWHRQAAKKLANEALDYWKKKRGPTEEDLRIEADKMYRMIAKQVVADIKAKWDLVLQHVEDKRRVKWEAEQELRRQERLKRQLAWSENMVAKQRGEVDGDGTSEGEFDSADDDDENEDSSVEDEDSDENMTDDSSEEDLPGKDDGAMDDDALQAYLAQRQAEPPARRSQLAELLEEDATVAGQDDEHDDEDEAMPDVEAPIHEEPTSNTIAAEVIATAEEVKERPLSPESDTHGLSSDESVDMDSEDYDSDDTDESDGSEDDHSTSSEQGGGLLGFFSKADLRAQGLPTPVTSAEGDNERDNEHVEDSDKMDTADDLAPKVSVEASELAEPQPLQKSHLSSLQVSSRPDTPASQSRSEASGKQLVPQPALLRGTLRSYQHAGLDWLASLYRNETNGILADEMGLGKTIQTISLFAHLAEQHNVWDPHLVIVPTSVLLNWVTEFQKFLPGFRVLGYYGSTEERHAKRRGWVNDPHHEIRDKRGYNVIVTSYAIALKDINAIRNVQWHYMVLDEAHNIRNFNSQRFQNLIKLKTRARVLLTGTPLQNSLTELWSLLTFLTAGRDAGEAAHGGLEEFLARWKEPVNEIFERGVQTLSDEAAKVVGQLHTSLRPFMLRRLKADVEKDLPKKIEHVVVCKLSKRQRQLYQDYMGLSDTRAKLTQGNAISAGKVLLSLRKVCNHPDLFDPRPIQTNYAMERSPLEPFSVKEQAVRRLLSAHDPTPHNLLLTPLESDRRYRKSRAKQLSGIDNLQRQVELLERSPAIDVPDTTTIAGCQALHRVQRRNKHLQQLKDSIAYTEAYFSSRPIFGSDLRELLTLRGKTTTLGSPILGRLHITTSDSTNTPGTLFGAEAPFDKRIAHSSIVQHDLQTAQTRADSLHAAIVRFTFCPPEATAPILDYAIDQRIQKVIRASDAYPEECDPAHEARMRTSVVFPDSRLLVYDAGKLQRLTTLLRELQAKGSRSLIFTQMSGSLDILERFLSLMSLPYLRLDGSTPIERRALYSAEFNRPDSKYQCMILSSRAGGVGLNLTGASSVIFYDLDWNPQMDKQCMDRAHRIGQVRDVEVFKMVSEKTVEENILRRANQKSLLDQTVIQEGNFTTDYSRSRDDDDVAAAIDRLLSGGDKAITKTIESVEDKEDVQAAQQARKEELQDDEDFAEHPSKGASVPPTPGLGNVDQADVDLDGHIDSYMVNYIEEALRYVPYVPPVVVTRDPSHRKKRRR
ncbi:hypothetical protein AMS68_003443 [Peltaster fructicola]|uniref:DNA helicase n=1 Tax=Peltaster fructicola TaxID=286661 RepID=A0A6H0XTC9_9PEZI|nr:hypothetical protein AMS68_003443 [Peltaster fructicola]